MDSLSLQRTSTMAVFQQTVLLTIKARGGTMTVINPISTVFTMEHQIIQIRMELVLYGASGILVRTL